MGAAQVGEQVGLFTNKRAALHAGTYCIGQKKGPVFVHAGIFWRTKCKNCIVDEAANQGHVTLTHLVFANLACCRHGHGYDALKSHGWR